MSKNYLCMVLIYMIVMSGCNDSKEGKKGNGNINNEQANTVPITCQLQAKIDNGKEVTLDLVFLNKSNSSICIEKRLLLMNKELDGASFFSVQRNSTEIPYRGLLIKRKELGPNDYYALLPNKCVNASVRLNDFFDLSISGHYIISYEIYFIDPKTNTGIEVKSNTIRIEKDN